MSSRGSVPPDTIQPRAVYTSPLDRHRPGAVLFPDEAAFIAEKRAAGVPDRAIADMLGRPVAALGYPVATVAVKSAQRPEPRPVHPRRPRLTTWHAKGSR